MTTSEEQQVLQLLAKEWDYTGPPGILDNGFWMLDISRRHSGFIPIHPLIRIQCRLDKIDGLIMTHMRN